MKWVYTDCRERMPKTLFECEAEMVLSADKLFEMSTGLEASKQPYITVKSPDWSRVVQ